MALRVESLLDTLLPYQNPGLAPSSSASYPPSYIAPCTEVGDGIYTLIPASHVETEMKFRAPGLSVALPSACC